MVTKLEKQLARAKATIKNLNDKKRKKGTKRGTSTISKISKFGVPIASSIAFVSQVVNKDLPSNFNTLDMKNKFKQITGQLVGNISGFQIYNDISVSKKFNPEGILNKWSGVGVASLLYGFLAPKGFPHKGLAKKLGSSMSLAGVFGGLFDAPNLGAQGVQDQKPNRLSSAPNSDVWGL